MKYISTRGAAEAVSSAMAIKQGLAPDGGLYVPEYIPHLSSEDLKALCAMDYPHRAAAILHLYLQDSYEAEELLSDCIAAYDESRFPGGAAPITSPLDGISMLELWHGPTAAFKDMALQIMPRLLSRALEKTGETRKARILVATSGDTGKAALEGYRDVEGVSISVFYPVDGVSRVQKLQMATQEGNNVSVHSVVGNFDDAQSGVKAIFSDGDAAKELSERGYFFSSANSINWGRLAPQIVYYVSAWCDLTACGVLHEGDLLDVCVPTGNFGNILAAYFAKRMGVPLGKLLCASNRNHVLTDFFKEGIYDRNRAFHTTVSPSMDILISSNLERLLYLHGGAELTADLMKQLKEQGRYTVPAPIMEDILADFDADYCDEQGTADTIRELWQNASVLIDTHTAVAMHCARLYLADREKANHMLVVSTASPYKFAPAVYHALTDKRFENELDAMSALNEMTGVATPAPLCGIESRPIRFDPEHAILPVAMWQTVLSTL